MIVKLAVGNLKTRFGEFQEILFYDGQKETVAFFMGDIDGVGDILCRVHSSCIFGHYFNSIECDCREQMEIAQQLIQKKGQGIIILMDQEGKGNGHFALLKSMEYKRKGIAQADAYEAVGFSRDSHDFSAAAKILNELNVKSVRMLTDNPGKVKSLTQFGIEVTGTREMSLE